MRHAILLLFPFVAAIGCTSPRADVPAPEPKAPCADPPTAQQQSSRVEPTGAEQTRLRTELLDPNRVTVITCGTGSPVPSGRAQACTAVFVAGKMFVFDAGDRAQAMMVRLNLPVQDLSAVFLTHFHADHIADLGEMISRSWIMGRQTELTV